MEPDLGGAPLCMGQQAGGGKISLLVALARMEKSLPYSKFSDWAGGMKGKFVISRYDGGGQWLLDRWLFADILLWIPVKRLSCGCVLKKLCQTSFPQKCPHNGVNNEHF